MLSFVFGLFIYLAAYLYILIALANFLHPITRFVSVTILSLSFVPAIISARHLPLKTFFIPFSKIRFTFLGVFGSLLGLIWFIIVINRVTFCVDTYVYHLPFACLLNHSIWYPGIGNLSLVYAFPNGTSVLASLFTSFDRPGLEFIPEFLIWIAFGLGIFIYLVKERINSLLAFLVSIMFLLTPRFFWESYNMGTDLPMACFLLFGLLAFWKKNYSEAALLFAISAIFKPVGGFTYMFFMSGLVVYVILKRNIKAVWDFKLILSIIVFLLVIIRMYISTGNPFYPTIPLTLEPWSIPMEHQNKMLEGIKIPMRTIMSNYKSSPFWVFTFLWDFLIFPKKANSSYWFSPFFLVTSFSALCLSIKNRRYRNIGINVKLIAILLVILLTGWFLNAAEFRFIAGVLIFISLIFFVYSIKETKSSVLKGLIYFSIVFTLAAFIVNVKHHFRDYIIPYLGKSVEATEKYMPYYKHKQMGMFTTITMPDGFQYSVSRTTYCGRSKAPCLHAFTLANKNDIIEIYKLYNRKFIK